MAGSGVIGCGWKKKEREEEYTNIFHGKFTYALLIRNRNIVNI